MPLTIRDDYPTGTARGCTCYICGAGLRRLGGRTERVVDTQQTIDFEGFLMFCETCMVEGARLLGMETAERVDDMLRDAALVMQERDEAIARAETAEGAVEAFGSYFKPQVVTESTTGTAKPRAKKAAVPA